MQPLKLVAARAGTAFVLPAILFATLLAGCGGGGGESIAGIDRLGVSTGTVNGFGSVVVNGVRYEVTGQTRIDLESGPGTEADLSIGQQVTVRWVGDDAGANRRAEEIRYRSTVEGPITAIDPAAGTVVVLGQVVRMDAGTSFDGGISPRDIAGLTVGDLIEVSGPLTNDGLIRATRIAPQPAGQPLKVRGFATDVTSQTFRINTLVVNYGGANLPDGTFANGEIVQALGNLLNGLGQLVAVEVRREATPASGLGEGAEIELEGYITRFVSATDFDVAGTPATSTPQTRYDGGGPGDLAQNVRVEVDGRLNADGVLVAGEIAFEDDDGGTARAAGNVTAVNPAIGTLAVNSVTVTVTPDTRLDDLSQAALRPFGLADIAAGDYVDARGIPGQGATLTATLLERDDPSDEGRLRGPASAIASPALAVLGVPVTSNGATEFRDKDGNAITAGQFFSTVAPGTVVEARYSQSAQAGGPILASRLELAENAANLTCPPDQGPVVIEGNVTVTGDCVLTGTRVFGNVLVHGGGSLTAVGADIDGNIQADGAAFVVVDQTQVSGDIQLDGLAGSASSITGNTVGGNIQLMGNTVSLLIQDNTVDGNLQCQGNSPAPTGGNNQVDGNKEDQCAGL